MIPKDKLRELARATGNGQFLDVDSIGANLEVRFVFGGHRMAFSTDGGDTVHAKMLDTGAEASFEVGYNLDTQKPVLTWQTKPTIDLQVAADVVVAIVFDIARLAGAGIVGGVTH